MTTDYQRIVAALRAAIDSGEHPPGAQLPTGGELAEKYGVNRNTAYKALQSLAAAGYVDLAPRRPAVVRERLRERVLIRDRLVYRDELGYYFDRNAQSWRPIGAPAHRIDVPPNHIADLLGVPRGGNVLIRERAMGPADAKRALQLAFSYLPLDLVAEIPVIGGSKTGPGGIYDRIEEHFEEPIQWRETVSARNASPAEQKQLGVPAAAAVLVVTRLSTVAMKGGKARPVEVNETSMASEQFAVSYAVERDPSASWPPAK
jgi:GntR family transcriptional regulator